LEEGVLEGAPETAGECKNRPRRA